MSTSRSFTEQVRDLKLLIDNTNERQVKIITEALLHPEHLILTSNFVTKHINKITDLDLRNLLHEINNYLRGKFADKTTEYVSGNEEYESLLSFWDNLANLQQDELQKMLERRIPLLTDVREAALADQERLRSTETDNHVYALYVKAKEYEDCFSPIIFTMVSKLTNIELKNKYSNFIIEARTHCSRLRFLCLKNLITQSLLKIDYDRRERLRDSDHIVDRNHLDKVINVKEECAKELINIFIHPLLRKSYPDLYAIFNDAYKMLGMINLELTRLNHGKSEFNGLDFTLVPAKVDIDAVFYGNLLPGDERLTYAVKPIEQHIAWADLSVNLIYCQFKNAMQIYQAEEIKAGREPYKNFRLEKLHQAMLIINLGSGVWGHDIIRKINYVIFIHRTIEDLKQFKIPEKQNLNTFTDVLENVFVSLWRAAIGELWEFSLQQSPLFHIIQQKCDYYHLVCEQKFYIVMIDLLTQMRRLGKREFTYLATEMLIAKNTRAEEFLEYYEKFGFDGLVDILLDKINISEGKIAQYKVQYQIENEAKVNRVNPLTANSAAEKVYHELVANFDLEAKQIQAQAKLEMEKKKKNFKKKNKPKLQPQQFFAPKTQVETEELSEQAKKYFAVGYKLNLSDNLDQAIQEYEDLVTPYLQASEDKSNVTFDYFHIAATFVELTDCYNQKAFRNTPNNFCNIEKANAEELLEWYEKAKYFASHALDCFVTHVAPRVHEYANISKSKKYEDLATLTHTFLKSATDKLNFMRNHYKNLESTLEEQLETLRQERIAAQARLGHRWYNNNAPKNIYRDMRAKLAKNIQAIKICGEKMENFIVKSVQPLQECFAYLSGMNSPKQQTEPLVNDFQFRLLQVAEYIKLLNNDSNIRILTAKPLLKICAPEHKETSFMSLTK